MDNFSPRRRGPATSTVIPSATGWKAESTWTGLCEQLLELFELALQAGVARNYAPLKRIFSGIVRKSFGGPQALRFAGRRGVEHSRRIDAGSHFSERPSTEMLAAFLRVRGGWHLSGDKFVICLSFSRHLHGDMVNKMAPVSEAKEGCGDEDGIEKFHHCGRGAIV